MFQSEEEAEKNMQNTIKILINFKHTKEKKKNSIEERCNPQLLLKKKKKTQFKQKQKILLLISIHKKWSEERNFNKKKKKGNFKLWTPTKNKWKKYFKTFAGEKAV